MVKLIYARNGKIKFRKDDYDEIVRFEWGEHGEGQPDSEALWPAGSWSIDHEWWSLDDVGWHRRNELPSLPGRGGERRVPQALRIRRFHHQWDEGSVIPLKNTRRGNRQTGGALPDVKIWESVVFSKDWKK